MYVADWTNQTTTDELNGLSYVLEHMSNKVDLQLQIKGLLQANCISKTGYSLSCVEGSSGVRASFNV